MIKLQLQKRSQILGKNVRSLIRNLDIFENIVIFDRLIYFYLYKLNETNCCSVTKIRCKKKWIILFIILFRDLYQIEEPSLQCECITQINRVFSFYIYMYVFLCFKSWKKVLNNFFCDLFIVTIWMFYLFISD